MTFLKQVFVSDSGALKSPRKITPYFMMFSSPYLSTPYLTLSMLQLKLPKVALKDSHCAEIEHC